MGGSMSWLVFSLKLVCQVKVELTAAVAMLLSGTKLPRVVTSLH